MTYLGEQFVYFFFSKDHRKCSWIQIILLVSFKLCKNEAFDFTPSILQLILPIVSLTDFEFLA